MRTHPFPRCVPTATMGFLGVALLALAGCTEPAASVAIEETALPPETAPHYVDIDTLGLEISNVWVKISALPFPVVDEVTMRWEVEARTNNPYWSPKSFHRRGARYFTQGDSAQVWGNVPRAYDFTISVQIEAWGEVYDVERMTVAAPECPEGPPTLICNW